MIKHIEENIGGPELGKDFLSGTHKIQIIKEKMANWMSQKLNTCVFFPKDIVKTMKTQAIIGTKFLQNKCLLKYIYIPLVALAG